MQSGFNLLYPENVEVSIHRRWIVITYRNQTPVRHTTKIIPPNLHELKQIQERTLVNHEGVLVDIHYPVGVKAENILEIPQGRCARHGNVFATRKARGANSKKFVVSGACRVNYQAGSQLSVIFLCPESFGISFSN